MARSCCRKIRHTVCGREANASVTSLISSPLAYIHSIHANPEQGHDRLRPCCVVQNVGLAVTIVGVVAGQLLLGQHIFAQEEEDLREGDEEDGRNDGEPDLQCSTVNQ